MRTLRRASIFSVIAVVGVSAVAEAKEYNRRQNIAPEVQSTLQRTLAKNRKGVPGNAVVITDDIVNTGCGSLEIGNIAETRPGQKIDRDIIITGNVINAPRNCRGKTIINPGRQ